MTSTKVQFQAQLCAGAAVPAKSGQKEGGSDQQGAVESVQGRKRRWSLLGGKAHPGLFRTPQDDRQNEGDVEGVSRKRSDFRCRRSRKSLGDSGLVALAALGGHIRRHDMLAMSLTAVFCHLDTANSLLKASKTCPGQKRAKGQGDHTHGPEAMSLG